MAGSCWMRRAVDKTKLDEFRTNNIALSNQLAETKRRFEGIESEQVRAVAAERDALKISRMQSASSAPSRSRFASSSASLPPASASPRATQRSAPHTARASSHPAAAGRRSIPRHGASENWRDSSETR